MTALMSVLVGVLFASATYLLLRRSLVRVLMGLALLSYGTNLLILTAGGLTRGRPPIIEAGRQAAERTVADPLPQALVLTAIVISFAVLAFALVLFQRVYQVTGSDDLDELRGTEDLP